MKNTKKIFESIVIEVVRFDNEDVITTSNEWTTIFFGNSGTKSSNNDILDSIQNADNIYEFK